MVAGVMYMIILCNDCCCNVYAYFLCKLASTLVIGLFDCVVVVLTYIVMLQDFEHG